MYMKIWKLEIKNMTKLFLLTILSYNVKTLAIVVYILINIFYFSKIKSGRKTY